MDCGAAPLRPIHLEYARFVYVTKSVLLLLCKVGVLESALSGATSDSKPPNSTPLCSKGLDAACLLCRAKHLLDLVAGNAGD